MVRIGAPFVTYRKLYARVPRVANFGGAPLQQFDRRTDIVTRFRCVRSSFRLRDGGRWTKYDRTCRDEETYCRTRRPAAVRPAYTSSSLRRVAVTSTNPVIRGLHLAKAGLHPVLG